MNKIGEIWRRLVLLTRREQLEEELGEEMRFHLEMKIQDNIEAGMSPSQARRAAYLQFGNRTLAREDSRELWGFGWLDRLGQDLRFGFRMLAKSPGFTSIAVLSLALGIGANTAIFSVVNAVLLRQLPFKDPDRLVSMHRITLADGRDGIPSHSVAVAWGEKAELPELTSWAGNYTTRGPYLLDGVPRELHELSVGVDLFQVLGTNPVLGRNFSAAESGEVIISHGLWQRHYGGAPDVIGRGISGNGRPSDVIVGVMPPGFWVHPWTADADLWAAVKNPGGYLKPIGRLKPGTTIEQAEAEINVIAENTEKHAFYAKYPARLELRPLKRVIADRYGSTLNLLSGAVGFVLLMGCANVAVLLLGRATRRHKEISTRAALGAGRWRLVRQLMTESALLAGAGGLSGTVVAYGGIKLFTMLAPEWYPPSEEIGVDEQVLANTLGIALLTGLLFGLVPALQSSKQDLTVALKEGARDTAGDSRRRLRRLLAVSEVAIALTLLAGAGLMINSFVRLVTADRGFNQKSLLTMTFRLGGEAYWDEEHRRPKPGAVARVERVIDRVKTLPGVVSAGLNSYIFQPGRGEFFRIVGRAEPASADDPMAKYNETGGDFFGTMETPLIRGRLFTRQDTEGSHRVAIINQALARKFFPNEDPIGKSLQTPRIRSYSYEEPREIVGIVGDIISFVRGGGRPEIFVPYRQYTRTRKGEYYTLRKYFVIRTATEPMSLVEDVRKAVSDIDPELTPDFETMETAVANSSGIEAWGASAVSEIQSLRFHVRLLSIFAGLGLFLAAVGLFGVISYSVAQRTHEFGLRMALGAQRSDVLRDVLREALVLTLLGLGIGAVASLALTRFIESQLIGVTSTDPATFAAVSAVLVGFALLAAYVPARRAASVDPMVAMRHE